MSQACVKVGKGGALQDSAVPAEPLCADLFVLAARAFGQKAHSMCALHSREKRS